MSFWDIFIGSYQLGNILNLIYPPAMFFVVVTTVLMILLTGNARAFAKGIRLFFTKKPQATSAEYREMEGLFRFASRVTLYGALIWAIVGTVNIMANMNFLDSRWLVDTIGIVFNVVLTVFYALLLNMLLFLPAAYRFQKLAIRAEVVSLHPEPLSESQPEHCQSKVAVRRLSLTRGREGSKFSV